MGRRRRLSSVLLPVGMAGLLLGAAACGSSDSGGGAAAPNAKDTSLDSKTTQELATQAEQEGSLTWYTTFADDDVQPIVAAFNKAYPKVKVNSLRLSADKIPQRILTEQRGGKHNADVVSGDSPQLAQLLQAGALQPYTPKDIAPLPSGLDLPEGYEGVVYIVTTAVGYNPKQVKQKGLPAPKSWEDLTKPAWKGQFSIDPGAVNWYDSLVQSMGHDKALDLLKRLGANSPVFVESHTQALTQVQAGEPIAAATIYGYKASSLKEKTPDSVEFVNSNPLPASLTLVDVVKDAPHPAAARLFEDWIVSKEGQTAVVDITNHTSIRPDVKNDPTVWDETKWPAAWGKPNLPAAEYNTELSEMKSALKAP
jgi:iron(III) transport system substrate-binding protein